MSTSPAKFAERINWVQSVPFLLMHAGVLLAFVTGVHWSWVLLAVASYAVRMFGVTAGYHRYFSHRAFRAGRGMQFMLAVLAQSSLQKGALWWAAHHRHHHRHSDDEHDLHSPARRGFWWSHVGWFLSDRYSDTQLTAIRDFAAFPELQWLNRFHWVPGVALAAVMTLALGLPGFVWGFVVPTVVLWHATFFINSLAHIFGSRRYLTTDTSRNNAWLAVLALGEGWHNNHHFHQNTANQGWFWWELDVTFYGLLVLEKLGLVSHLRRPPESTRLSYLTYTPAQRAQLRQESGFNLGKPPPPRRAETPEGVPLARPQLAR